MVTLARLKVSLIAILASSLMVPMAYGQDDSSEESTPTYRKSSRTGTKLKRVKPKETTSTSGEPDADEVITNRKLRAETGSKKKFSFSTSMSYSGGSVERPMDAKRPNITGAIGEQEDVALNGSIGIKYKITSLQSLSLSLGLGVDKPFHSDEEKSFNDRSYADDPTLTYQILYKVAGIQNVTSLAVNAFTSDFKRELGYHTGWNLTQTLIYDFGGSKFSVGSSIEGTYNYFDLHDDYSMSKQSDYGLAVYPFMEYVLNDWLNLRTLSGLWVYQHRREEYDYWTFKKNKIYQSFGIGISLTRDFYLYPNVQFMPEDMRSDRTNVGLSATINM